MQLCRLVLPISLFRPFKSLGSLEELERKGREVVAYVDYVALVFRGKFIDTLYNLILGYLNAVVSWTADYGQSVKPLKVSL